jgi:hypothetical protein
VRKKAYPMSDHEEKVEIRRVATNSPESMAIFNDLLDRFIKPNAESIAELALRKEVAVLVADVHSEEAREALRALGWDGTATVFRLSHAARRRRAESCLNNYGDSVTHRWLTKPGKRGYARVLVYHHAGTLLLNHTDEGWALEPGSTDDARMQGMH